MPLRDIARASGKDFQFDSDHIRAFESMLRLLSDEVTPALLVIEDVHWADTATVDPSVFWHGEFLGCAPWS